MQFSVILTTFNRSGVVRRAIDSVLSQEAEDFELLVVDDGSTDDTQAVLAIVDDPRMTVCGRTNGGLSAARNTGIGKASGDWICFLDDDDYALPGWLEGFNRAIDEDAGIVCCGAEYRTSEGALVSSVRPEQMGPLYEHQVGTRIAGTFAVRADLLRSVGGYDERMTCSHQSELLMRLIPEMLSRGLSMRHTDRILVVCETRTAVERTMRTPMALYEGTTHLLKKHRDKISLHPKNLAVYSGIVGVSAARLGRWPEARRAFMTAVRSEPRNVRHWLRFGAALCRPIGRRAWKVNAYSPDAGRI